jgi:hypothetical protein
MPASLSQHPAGKGLQHRVQLRPDGRPAEKGLCAGYAARDAVLFFSNVAGHGQITASLAKQDAIKLYRRCMESKGLPGGQGLSAVG